MNTLFEIIFFILFLILCLYLPGKFFLEKLRLKLTSPQDIFFAFGFGLILFTLFAYILAWIRADILLIPLYLCISFLTIKNNYWKSSRLKKEHVKPLLLVAFLAILFSTSMLIAGKFGETLIMRHDDSWHLALINELRANFPPDNPGMSEIPLKGYHFFYNFILSRISNFFFISPISLHFHFFPLLIAGLWGLGVYSLLFSWSKKKSVALWGVFLTMFGGSFAFILVLQGHPEVNLNAGLGILQPALSLYNPPFALSIIIIITALLALYHYLTTKQALWLVPLTLCVGIITMIKVYAGMLLLGGLLVVSALLFLKKQFHILWAVLGSGILFFGTYWIFGANSGYLIFYPWWPTYKLLQGFTWYGYDEKMYTYMQQGVIRGIIETQVYAFSLFILGNLGTRLIGLVVALLFMIKKRTLPSIFGITIGSMTLAALFTPLLFIQSGKVFEIIQMGMYYVFFCSLFASFGLAWFFSLRFSKFIKLFLITGIVVVTLPSSYETSLGYVSALTSPQNLTSPYYQTLTYLSSQADYNATVLEMPPAETFATDKDIEKWYETSTPIIGAFSNKRMYFNNEFIIFPGVNLKPRLNFLKKMVSFAKADTNSKEYPSVVTELGKELRERNIHYIYSPYFIPNIVALKGIKTIYTNGPHTLYKISY